MAPLNSNWPRWPADTTGKRMVHVGVALDVDTLFRTLYAPASAFVVSSQDARGNKEYRETPWVATDAALQAVDTELVAAPAPLSTAAPAVAGSVRRVGFSAAGMGMKYKTEELQRVVEAVPGSTYVIEGCVFTTATYGETFRPITRTRLTVGETAGTSEWHIESTMVYLTSVSRFVKSCIERGAESGMSKNFIQYTALLGKEATVTDLTKVKRSASQPALKVAPSDAAQVDVPAATQEVQQRLWGGLLDPTLAARLQPVSACITRLLPGGGNRENSGGRPGRSAQAIAALLVVGAVHVAMRPLSAVAAVSHSLPGAAGHLAATLLPGGAGVPTTVGVLSCFALVVSLQALLSFVVGLMPGLLQALNWRPQAAAALVSPSPASISSEEAPSKGVRFEGYDDAFSEGMTHAAPDPPRITSPLSQTMQDYAGAVRNMWNDSFSAILSPRSAAAASAGDKLPAGGLTQQLVGRSPPRAASTPALVRGTGESDSAAGDGTAVDAAAGGSPPPEEDLEPGPRLEEVFENERAQPFRGWGHTWPGHFLPTDRVGHWSSRTGAPGGRQSMSFRSVAPRLRPGHEWEEDKWHVDLSGHTAGAVDAEGWAYAVDFAWLPTPPPPGAGRKKVTDFVRRRRWVRSQRPVTTSEDDDLARPTVAPTGGEEEGAVLGSSPSPAGDALDRLSHSPMKLSKPRAPPAPVVPEEAAAPSAAQAVPGRSLAASSNELASGKRSWPSSPSGAVASAAAAAAAAVSSAPTAGSVIASAASADAAADSIAAAASGTAPTATSTLEDASSTVSVDAADAKAANPAADSQTAADSGQTVGGVSPAAEGNGDRGGHHATEAPAHQLPPTPEQLLAIEEVEAALAKPSPLRQSSGELSAPTPPGAPAASLAGALTLQRTLSHTLSNASSIGMPASPVSPGRQLSSPPDPPGPTLPPPQERSAARGGFRLNFPSWLTKGAPAEGPTGMPAGGSPASSARGSFPGSLAGSTTTSPKVAAPMLGGTRLAPDQAAAAARLLMAGNSLPGMPDTTFAAARPSAQMPVQPPVHSAPVPSMPASGHVPMGAGGQVGGVSPPARSDSGHLSFTSPAAVPIDRADSEPEGTSPRAWPQLVSQEGAGARRSPSVDGGLGPGGVRVRHRLHSSASADAPPPSPISTAGATAALPAAEGLEFTEATPPSQQPDNQSGTEVLPAPPDQGSVPASAAMIEPGRMQADPAVSAVSVSPTAATSAAGGVPVAVAAARRDLDGVPAGRTSEELSQAGPLPGPLEGSPGGPAGGPMKGPSGEAPIDRIPWVGTVSALAGAIADADEVPSHLEDLEGRRAFIATAAALGSTDTDIPDATLPAEEQPHTLPLDPPPAAAAPATTGLPPLHEQTES